MIAERAVLVGSPDYCDFLSIVSFLIRCRYFETIMIRLASQENFIRSFVWKKKIMFPERAVLVGSPDYCDFLLIASFIIRCRYFETIMVRLTSQENFTFFCLKKEDNDRRTSSTRRQSWLLRFSFDCFISHQM